MVAFCIAGVLMAVGLILISLAFYVYRRAFRRAQLCFALLDLLVALWVWLFFLRFTVILLLCYIWSHFKGSSFRSTTGCLLAFLLLISECRRILCECAIVRMLFPRLALEVRSLWRKKGINSHRVVSNQYFDQLKMSWQ